jgi:hypothetical protein
MICDDEIEEGFQLRASVPFCRFRTLLCDDFQEMEEILTPNRFQILLPEEDIEVSQQVLVANHGAWSEI